MRIRSLCPSVRITLPCLLASTVFFAPIRLKASPETKVPSAASAVQVEWTSENGNVLLNGQIFHIKGVNWFGLETPGAKLLGLNQRSMGDLLDWLQAEGFNALRVPLSVQWALNPEAIPKDQNFHKEDDELRGKPWGAMLAKLIRESAKRGIVLMLDLHTISAGDNLSTKLWYNEHYSVCDFRRAWQLIIDSYGDHWNILGLDLKNELQDVTWGTAALTKESPVSCSPNVDDPDLSPPHDGRHPTDWRQEVERLIPELAVPHRSPEGHIFSFRGLYIVQGMHQGQIGSLAYPYDQPKAYSYWYGGNLEGLRHYPLRLPASLQSKIAYTIHTYGPSVWPQSHFESLDAYHHPERLAEVFELQSGFIEPLTHRALLIGEWGGRNEILKGESNPVKNGKDDAAILDGIADWYRDHCIADGFWWALNPESSDTGGLFQDESYSAPVAHRLARAHQLQPYPSVISVSAQQDLVFTQPGSFSEGCLSSQAQDHKAP